MDVWIDVGRQDDSCGRSLQWPAMGRAPRAAGQVTGCSSWMECPAASKSRRMAHGIWLPTRHAMLYGVRKRIAAQVRRSTAARCSTNRQTGHTRTAMPMPMPTLHSCFGEHRRRQRLLGIARSTHGRCPGSPKPSQAKRARARARSDLIKLILSYCCCCCCYHTASAAVGRASCQRCRRCGRARACRGLLHGGGRGRGRWRWG